MRITIETNFSIYLMELKKITSIQSNLDRVQSNAIKRMVRPNGGEVPDGLKVIWNIPNSFSNDEKVNLIDMMKVYLKGASIHEIHQSTTNYTVKDRLTINYFKNAYYEAFINLYNSGKLKFE